MSGSVSAAAEAIFVARGSLSQIPRISESFGIADAAAAYEVQRTNSERYIAEGRRVVGRKIGLTSKAVQQQLGVDQPDFGTLWADYNFAEATVIPYSRFIQPKVEAEVAFVIGRRIPEADVGLAQVVAAIEYAVPAVEIVDSAIANWSITLVDTIADNASAGGFCVGTGARRLTDLDLRLAGCVLSRNGAVASLGVGAACLGHPLNATLWLARKMAEVGTPLTEGDIVLSGALGPMVAVEAGDVISVEIQGFSGLNFAFGKMDQL
jgi:2-keto-4-pentenoate hydratase